MESECKGCLNYIEGSTFIKSSCSFRVNATALCPCRNCLVKPMCEEPCDRYSYFRSNLDTPGRMKNYKEYFSYET